LLQCGEAGVGRGLIAIEEGELFSPSFFSLKASKALFKLDSLAEQGDQIGRIFAKRVTVYFGQIF
jgi:hypothetical protein